MSEAAWLVERRTYLGGSDISALLGVNQYRGAVNVWEDKLGYSDEKVMSWPMQRGTFLEPAVANAYCKTRNVWLASVERIRHPEYNFIGGNPDRVRLTGKNGSAVAVVEIKTVGIRQAYKWGQPGEQKCPMDYFIQANHYAGLYGMDEFDLVAYIEGRDDLHVDTFPFNENIYNAGIEAGVRFWKDHVEARVAPPPDSTSGYVDYLERQFPKDSGIVVEATQDLNDLVEGYAALLGEIKELEGRKTSIDTQLKAAIGEASAINTSVGTFTWKQGAGKTSWKSAAESLAEKLYGESVAEKLKLIQDEFRGKPSRTFRTPFSSERSYE